MKITCQSCQSKYTVSDEKVQGKTVKIKCRKCGATILVSSSGVTTSASEPASTAAGASPEAGVSYLVNVGQGDQRTMTVPDIVAAYQSGAVTADTYVWADGMTDWLPLGQIPSLVAALNAPAAPVAVPALAPEVAAPVPAEPEHRLAARRDAPRPAQDLFGGQQDVMAPAAAPSYDAMPAGPMPAARPAAKPGEPENSMLFSLSALTAKPGVPAAGPKSGHDGEDSGVIDLKALAAGGQSQAASAPAAFLPDGGLFPFGAPTSGSAAAPPVVAPSLPPPKSKTPLFLGLGAVVAVGAIVGAFLVMRGGPPPPPAPATSDTATAAPTATVTAAPTATATAEATAAPTASAVASADVPKGHKTGGKAGGGKAGGSKAGGAAPPPSTTPSKPPASGPKKGNCGCAPGDLMCAMKCSAK